MSGLLPQQLGRKIAFNTYEEVVHLQFEGTSANGYKFLFLLSHVPFSRVLEITWRVMEGLGIFTYGSGGKTALLNQD